MPNGYEELLAMAVLFLPVIALVLFIAAMDSTPRGNPWHDRRR